MRVQLNPEALASRQIGIDEVEQAIQNANVNMPMGTLFGAHKAYNVESNGQLSDASVYRPFIVAYRNGAPVRLDQIATVIDGIQDRYVADWVNSIPGIMLSVQRQPGTNTIEIVNNIRKLIPRFYAMVPPSINLSVEYDRSVPIRESVERRRIHSSARRLSGHSCHLPVPAQPLRHHHAEPGAPDGDHGHVRGDVPARLHDRHACRCWR